MLITSKKELCNMLGEIIGVARSLTVNTLIGDSKSLDEAVKHTVNYVSGFIKENKELKFALSNILYKYEFGRDYIDEYERLMKWIAKDYNGFNSEERRNANIGSLMASIGAMDMFCVIRDNDDFILFKSDLEKRVGKKFV